MTIEVREKLEVVLGGQSVGSFTRSELHSLHSAVGKLLHKPSPHMSPEQILEEVCLHYAVTQSEVRGRGRQGRVVWPRQVAMLLLLEHGFSSNEAASFVGRSDHGTALHAKARVLDLCREKYQKGNELAHLRAKLMCKDQDAAE